MVYEARTFKSAKALKETINPAAEKKKAEEQSPKTDQRATPFLEREMNEFFASVNIIPGSLSACQSSTTSGDKVITEITVFFMREKS